MAEMSIEAFPARTDGSWAPASILMTDAGLEPEVCEEVDDLLAGVARKLKGAESASFL